MNSLSEYFDTWAKQLSNQYTFDDIQVGVMVYSPSAPESMDFKLTTKKFIEVQNKMHNTKQRSPANVLFMSQENIDKLKKTIKGLNDVT